MSERGAAVLVVAALRGRDHERAVLDRARAHQHVPVRLAGLPRERGGDREERRARFGERAIERRKAQVVADRHAEPAPRQVGDHREIARAIAARLAIALAAFQVDVEHVDLVVARDDLAAPVDQEAAVHRLVGRGLHGERADMDVDAERARKLAERRQRGVVLLRHDLGEQALARALQDVGHLGRLHVVGAAFLRLADHLHGRVHVVGRRAPRAHLDQADAEGRATVHAAVSLRPRAAHRACRLPRARRARRTRRHACRR